MRSWAAASHASRGGRLCQPIDRTTGSPYSRRQKQDRTTTARDHTADLAALAAGPSRRVPPKASSFGASPLQIVFKVLIPEALPGLLLALTLAVVSLLGYSAMVGAVGGGGLGDLGIRYGHQRFMPEMMLAVVVVLIALVQLVQSAGDYLARRVNRRLRHH